MPPGRGRSASPSEMRGRGRSNSPSRMRAANSRSRSIDPAETRGRGRSTSPSRGRGRSNSPSRISAAGNIRGRSSSPSRRRSSTRSRSIDLASRSGGGSVRGRSNSPTLRVRGRSNSPSRVRGRSNSPSRMRGRSNSPGGRSRASRSVSQEGRSKSSSGGMGRFRKGGKRKDKPPRAEGERGGRGKLHKGRKVLGKAPRAIAKAPKKIGRGIKRGGRRIKQRIAPKQDCPLWKVCAYVVPAVIILGCAIGLISATGSADKFTPTFVSNLIPRLDGKDVVDPFSGSSIGGGSTSVAKWNNGDSSNGLSIEVLNAMTPEWSKFFDLAISDWEFGNPDALTLTTDKATVDKDCTAVAGKIKVCNGDYGETKWRGINAQNFDTGGFIIASTAKMNEFYLLYDVDDAKQYTLCHELGHAFGLAHTDEIFGNEDLGNCLDYTDNFEVNKHPDASNYETLAGLYGSVEGRREERGLLRGSSPVADVPNGSNNEDDQQQKRELSESIMTKMHEAVERLAARMDNNAHEDGWKLLHRTRHGEAHELELDEGYKIQVQMLLAH